jgi:alkylation response protein AidB-like acyl-CoA dehydrogenase
MSVDEPEQVALLRETQRSVGAFDPVACAEGFAPALRERAAEIERARRLPADLSRDLAEAGLYRLWAPAAYGGLELPPVPVLRCFETLARADASTAWCVFIASTSSTVLAAIPESAAREVFADPRALICGVFAPSGVATPVEGGFRVSGRWAFGSGAANADWILGGCRLDLASGPRQHMALMRAGEVELLDTWHVSGLCGTGSTDFAARDVFVPEERIVGHRARPLARPLYTFPAFTLLGMGIAAVALGLGRAALDAFVALAGGKRPAGSQRTLAERGAVQGAVAQAEAALRSARAFFYEAVAAGWESACAKGLVSVEERRDIRLATTHATHAVAALATTLYTLGGGSAIYHASPLQRIFRDAHVATQHLMVGPATLELTGRLFLGLETDTSQL